MVLYLGPPTMKAVDRLRPRQQLLPREEKDEGKEQVFDLKPATISERIAAAALAAGLGEGYSGHSCRVGMAVDLAEAGATMPQLQAVGRWKSSQTVARYVARTVRRAAASSPNCIPASGRSQPDLRRCTRPAWTPGLSGTCIIEDDFPAFITPGLDLAFRDRRSVEVCAPWTTWFP